jgi:hypothetical protein
VRLLLVAEAPPSSFDRYFYFEDVRDQDSLFRHVVRAILAIEPSRSEKASELQQLADRGVFLIDLKPEPKRPGDALETYVPDLVTRATCGVPLFDRGRWRRASEPREAVTLACSPPGPQQSRQRSIAGERKTAAFQSPIEFWHPTSS